MTDFISLKDYTGSDSYSFRNTWILDSENNVYRNQNGDIICTFCGSYAHIPSRMSLASLIEMVKEKELKNDGFSSKKIKTIKRKRMWYKSKERWYNKRIQLSKKHPLVN